MSGHASLYLEEAARICGLMDPAAIERLAEVLARLRDRGGRLFLAGLGGSAANASHAAADFRRLAGIEAYALADNAAEATAAANDDGFGSMYTGMLQFARTGDALFILSVGGGKDGVSMPLLGAIGVAKAKRMEILGIVGRDGGATLKAGDCVVVVPTVSELRVTPHTEAFQGVLLHLLVSHPKLQRKPTKW